MTAEDRLSGLLLRIGLAAAGAYLLYMISFLFYSSPPVLYRQESFSILLVACGGFGLALTVAAALRHVPQGIAWAVLAAYLFGFLLHVFHALQANRAADVAVLDQSLYTDFGARLLLKGTNPYRWDYAGVFDLFRTPNAGATPRINGVPCVSTYPYPALSFLAVLPLQLLGLPGSFTLSVLCHLLTLTLLFIACPKPFKPIVLLPAVVSRDVTWLVLLGSMDAVWVLLVLAMLLAWNNRWARALLYGLAISAKQPPWLLAPFLLILVFRTGTETDTKGRWKRVGEFVLVSGLVFALINGPFFVGAPEEWFKGIAVNVGEDLVTYSEGGLGSLYQFGYARLPHGAYTAFTFVTIALSVFVYWRHFDSLWAVFWFFPAIFLWVSYRAINSYWVFWVLPALVTLTRPIEPRPGSRKAPGRWKQTVGVLAASLAVMLATGILLARADPNVETSVVRMWSTHGQVDGMLVEVHNLSQKSMVPRFAVQRHGAFYNQIYWTIQEGPAILSPGAKAIYKIAPEDKHGTFLFSESAQVTVTDAGGDYSLNAVIPIEPDETYLWPDNVANPTYKYWDSLRDTPALWSLTNEPTDEVGGVIPAEYRDEHPHVTLRLDASDEGYKRVALGTLATFPYRPFGLRVYLDPSDADWSGVAYGLEIDDGTHRVWFTFSDRDYEGYVPPDVHLVNQIVESGRWSTQEIDALAAYRVLGLPLPDLDLGMYRDLDVYVRSVSFRLFLATDVVRDEEITAQFGPVIQDLEPITDILVDQSLDDPAQYYLTLAEEHVLYRNEDRALEALETARRWAANDPSLVAKIDSKIEALLERTQ